MKSDDFDWSVTAALYSDGPLTYPDPLTHPERSNSTGWTKKSVLSKNENRPWWGFFEKKNPWGNPLTEPYDRKCGKFSKKKTKKSFKNLTKPKIRQFP